LQLLPLYVCGHILNSITRFEPDILADPSLRVAVEGQLLFKPFTFLGWDSLAYSPTRLVTGSNSSIDKLIRFGRPLYVLL